MKAELLDELGKLLKIVHQRKWRVNEAPNVPNDGDVCWQIQAIGPNGVVLGYFEWPEELPRRTAAAHAMLAALLRNNAEDILKELHHRIKLEVEVQQLRDGLHTLIEGAQNESNTPATAVNVGALHDLLNSVDHYEVDD